MFLGFWDKYLWEDVALQTTPGRFGVRCARCMCSTKHGMEASRTVLSFGAPGSRSKMSGTQGFAHDSLIEHGPFFPQPFQVLDIGYWKWTQVAQCSLVMDLDAPWQEYKDQILYSALALEYEWQPLLWTDCIDKIICPESFFLKKTLAKLPPTTVGLELLSNLRNLCGVWHAMGYSGRCGQDEELLKGCQINVPFESTWGTRIVTFLHLGWRWYIAWYSFWVGWRFDGGQQPGWSVCFRWYGGIRRLFACLSGLSLGMPRDHGSLLQWVWPWFLMLGLIQGIVSINPC